MNATAVLDFAEKINTLKKVRSSTQGADPNDELQRVLRTIVPELEQMKDMADSLRRRLLSVAENLTVLNDQIPQLTKEVPNWVLIAKNAQGLLASNLTGYARAVAADVVKRIQTFVDEYLQHVASQVSCCILSLSLLSVLAYQDKLSFQLDTEVSSCEPLTRAANAVYISVCNHALQPLVSVCYFFGDGRRSGIVLPFQNAFWASVGLFLLLCIPAVALASVLRDLYSNTDAYVASNW